MLLINGRQYATTDAESSRFGDKFHFIQTYKNRLEELTPEGLKLVNITAEK